MEQPTTMLRSRQNAVRYNWGFRFALWCSILWGTFFVAVGLLVRDDRFMGVAFSVRDSFHAAYVIESIVAVLIAVMCLAWLGFTGKLLDYAKVMFGHHRENHMLMLCALFGGLASYLSYVVGSWVDTTFAIGMVMFYPILGGIVAHLWSHERISQRCIVGLVFIISGCIVLYLPAVFGTEFGQRVLLSCTLGLLSGIGWGMEAVLASRVMDFVDSEVSNAVRYAYEAILWLVITAIVLIAPTGVPLPAYYAEVFSSPTSLVFLFFISLCFMLNAFSWYKSFTLCGVAKGLALSDLSGIISALYGMLLITASPSWTETLACMIMGVGVFIVYDRESRTAATLRDVDMTPSVRRLRRSRSTEMLPNKVYALVEIAEKGPLWDYDVVRAMESRAVDPHRKARFRRQIRVYLIEASAAGLLAPIEERVDDGSCISQGLLLSRYALTEYGCARLQNMGFMAMAEEAAAQPGLDRMEKVV